MINVSIPNSVSLNNFENIFKGNSFEFKGDDVSFSFHPKYIAMHPVGIAFLAAIGDLIKINGSKISGTLNREITSIIFLQRMGLFSSLGFENPLQFNDHEESGRFIPLKKIRNSKESKEFMQEIDPILHANRDSAPVIKHVFGELLRNIIEHSGAQYGGNVCATYNRKKKKVSIGISDAGMGLRKSLSKSHAIISDQDAIIKALTPGITGTTSRIGGNEQNAGAGLFFTKSIAKSTRNHFIIYSGCGYYKLRKVKKIKGDNIVLNPDPTLDENTQIDNAPFFPGTLVGIDVQINDSKVFTQLIQDIGKAYSSGVKKSKKDYYRKIQFS